MVERPQDLATALPADKFIPPRPDRGGWLERRHLLARLSDLAVRRRLTVVAAQAGQGKTVLAAQFAAHMRPQAPVAWIRLGVEDQEPVVLLQALRHQLAQLARDAGRSPAPAAGLGRQEPLERLRRLANQALTQLPLDTDCYLILDDLHWLDDSPDSRALLMHLIDHAPPSLHLVCAGRTRLAVCGLPVTSIGRIRNEELAFNEGDIRRLAPLLGKQQLSPQEARQLRQLTHGWVAGVLIYLEHLTPGGGLLDHPHAALREDLLDYFSHQVLSGLAPSTQRLLVQLAWLEPIDSATAAELLQLPQLHPQLEQFVQRHLFLQRADDRGRQYRMHRLFRDCLRQLSPRLIAEGARLSLLQQASRRAEAQDRPDEALRHAAAAGEPERIEQLLVRYCRRFLFAQHPDHLRDVLQQLPAERIESQPWLALLQSAVLGAEDEGRALRLLERARDAFAAAADGLGELIASAYLLTLHVTVDGHFGRAAPMLARSEQLYAELDGELDVPTRLLALTGMAGGAIFLDPDSARTRRHAEQALRLAQEHDVPHYEVRSRLVRGYDYICRGELEQAARELEHLHWHLQRPELDQRSQLLIRTLACNLLACSGLSDSFRRQAGKLRRHSQPGLFLKSSIAPTLHRWHADLALADGRLDLVLEHVDAGLTLGHAAFQPHVRSQLLQYRALVQALQGRVEAARTDALESETLRRQAGSYVHDLNNAVFLGATYAALGELVPAQAHLDRAADSVRWFTPGCRGRASTSTGPISCCPKSGCSGRRRKPQPFSASCATSAIRPVPAGCRQWRSGY